MRPAKVGYIARIPRHCHRKISFYITHEARYTIRIAESLIEKKNLPERLMFAFTNFAEIRKAMPTSLRNHNEGAD